MQNLNDTDKGEKYLKATPVASYHSEVAVSGTRSTFRPLVVLREGWGAVQRESRYLVGEYAISNAFVMAFLAKTRPATIAVSGSNEKKAPGRIQFAFNWVAAVLVLIVALPLFALVGLAIKLDSSGPIFYRQERVGINRRRRDRRANAVELVGCNRQRDRRSENNFGRPFMVFKFRTMVTDAEKRCGPVWATKNDPRITRVGRFLRKTRLDELPQLFNVLRGEMSLVGPRPERPHFVKSLSAEVDRYAYRLNVLPGITGLAQVEGGYDATVDDVKKKVRWDLEYIRTSSIKKDIAILFRTIGVVLGCRGM